MTEWETAALAGLEDQVRMALGRYQQLEQEADRAQSEANKAKRLLDVAENALDTFKAYLAGDPGEVPL
jgi:chromosome segregation ATPase